MVPVLTLEKSTREALCDVTCIFCVTLCDVTLEAEAGVPEFENSLSYVEGNLERITLSSFLIHKDDL